MKKKGIINDRIDHAVAKWLMITSINFTRNLIGCTFKNICKTHSGTQKVVML